jgi:hypothetical protein
VGYFRSSRWTSPAKEAVVTLRPENRARLSTGAAIGGAPKTEANMTKSNTRAQAESGASAGAAVSAAPKGKLGALVTLLRRERGATLPEMMDATGWQAHSVRGAIAGAIKKKLGLTVLSEKSEDGRSYRIPEAQA